MPWEIRGKSWHIKDKLTLADRRTERANQTQVNNNKSTHHNTVHASG